MLSNRRNISKQPRRGQRARPKKVPSHSLVAAILFFLVHHKEQWHEFWEAYHDAAPLHRPVALLSIIPQLELGNSRLPEITSPLIIWLMTLPIARRMGYPLSRELWVDQVVQPFHHQFRINNFLIPERGITDALPD